MTRVHQGEPEEGIKMYLGIKGYAKKYSHDDIRLAEFYGNMGEFLLTSKPDL